MTFDLVREKEKILNWCFLVKENWETVSQLLVDAVPKVEVTLFQYLECGSPVLRYLQQRRY